MRQKWLSKLFWIFRPLLIACLLLCSHACTSSSDQVNVSIPPTVDEDENYDAVLEKWRRDLKVFDRFQNRLEMSAVLFTEEMRQAYLSRWVKIRGDSFARIGMDVGGKLAILVSFFSPVEDYLRLDDHTVWTVRMAYGEKILSPVVIKRLYDKSMFASFFPFVHSWSQEYLIVFDASLSGSSDAMMLPSQVTAQFLSTLASVEVQWQ